ncbi:NlpC/P60 family protein [Mycobacterium sp. BK086]|uniref:C40 family peptidase n=1 Tax=Mycobacterium sp. BK086 TaxID=2512165 RepID=UPI00105B9BD8|nr:C40 family peptidase [Mycobacterium sp. BK086]TDO06501.1 NlpC/P60 family protein [Mycobacterium sp. BK086]
MSGSTASYVREVDRALGSSQALFSPTGVRAAGGTNGLSPPAAPLAGGTLSSGVSVVGDSYRVLSQGFDDLNDETDATSERGARDVSDGHTTAAAVRGAARSQAAAIAQATRSPAGVQALVSAMDGKLAAMQRQIGTTQAQNRLLALRLRQVAAAFRMAGMSSGGAPLSFGGAGAGGGGLPALGGMPALGALTSVGRQGLPHRSAAGENRAALTQMFGHDGRGSDAAEQAVAYAKTKLGLPYIWGASGPRAYDCSGLVQDSYQHAGIALPRTTYDLIHTGTPVSRGDVRAGDLVLSNFSAPGVPEHVQLAVSPTMVIEAPTPGGHVQYSSIPSGTVVVRRVAG